MKRTLALLAALAFLATPALAADHKDQDKHQTERTQTYEVTDEDNAKAEMDSYHSARMSVQERREQQQKLSRKRLQQDIERKKAKAAAEAAAKADAGADVKVEEAVEPPAAEVKIRTRGQLNQ